MPSNYETQLARIREESRRREELYRIRYASGTATTALQLAQRWRVALSSEPLDWAELAAIREEARENRMVADVAFFGFINELEKDYCLLRELQSE